MKKPYSKLGLALSAAYIIFALFMVISAFTCAGYFCGVVILIPALPWVYLWGSLVDGSANLQAYLALFFLAASFSLNAWIIYHIGKLLGRVFSYKPYR